jgi:DNA-binding transcriptional ArsR family regulator
VAIEGDADIAAVARVIGDRTRARFLRELVGGERRRASELASAAGISRATASFHLGKLREVGLVVAETSGSQRTYRLADPEIAHLIEALQRIAPRSEIRSLRGANSAQALSYARFRYDHLAGRLAVELVDAMSAGGLIALAGDRSELSRRGETWFEDELGIDVPRLRTARGSFARACLDWSERRQHLAGALGAALGSRLLELGWIERAPRGRAVLTTPTGRIHLAKMLKIGV